MAAVATGPDLGVGGAPLRIRHDAALAQFHQRAQRLRVWALADGFEHHVRFHRELLCAGD